MIIECKKSPLSWGSLDLALFGLEKDWYGMPVSRPVAFGMGMDDENFWFVSSQRKPATTHPDTAPFQYTPNLWKYDVTEFFIYHEQSGRYMEFNLAANGAWWCAEFVAPRVRAELEDVIMPGVNTYVDAADDGSWVAAMSIPLDLLKARLDFGESSRVNVTAIVNSPQQQFLTASPPSGGEPDFHCMDLMKKVAFQKEELTYQNIKS